MSGLSRISIPGVQISGGEIALDVFVQSAMLSLSKPAEPLCPFGDMMLNSGGFFFFWGGSYMVGRAVRWSI